MNNYSDLTIQDLIRIRNAYQILDKYDMVSYIDCRDWQDIEQEIDYRRRNLALDFN